MWHARNMPDADLLVTGAKLVATCDADGRELPGGWVAVTDGLISGVGSAADPPPAAAVTLDAAGCLVTPGLVPVGAWLRCGPVGARHTVVAGRALGQDHLR